MTWRRSAIQLAQTLAAAHHAGVLHGDIKPGKILLDAPGQPVLPASGWPASTLRRGPFRRPQAERLDERPGDRPRSRRTDPGARRA
ncbi:hypothetical protein K1W54_07065 [Micromonospora sp. CPCC 205371]|nr:hypothetical protein [Micromonospora sp. CPCC 205371]